MVGWAEQVGQSHLICLTFSVLIPIRAYDKNRTEQDQNRNRQLTEVINHNHALLLMSNYALFIDATRLMTT